MDTLTPQRILEVGIGFWPAKVLLSAVELGLFSALGASSRTAAELRVILGLAPRAVPDFPDALVALGFLERDGLGAAARYRNTPESAACLERRSPRYVGGSLEMANARLYPFWGDLTEALRTGKPQNELKGGGPGMFETLYADPARLRQFLAAMSAISHGANMTIARAFPWKDYRTFVDV